jgi:hypothetical protein
MSRTPPTPGTLQQTTWANRATSATFSPTGIAVSTGDLIVAFVTSENQPYFATIADSMGHTWTLQEDLNVASNARVQIWTAIANGNGTCTVTFTRDADVSTKWIGGAVRKWSSHGGIGSHTKGNGTATTGLAFTSQEDNSAWQVVNADWAGVDGTVRTWLTEAGSLTEGTYERLSTAGTSYSGIHPDAGDEGTHSVGLSAPSGQTWGIVVLEILGLHTAKPDIVRSRPTLAAGAAPASATAAWTAGSYSALLPNGWGADVALDQLEVKTPAAPALATTYEVLIEIATGAAGSEVVKAQFPWTFRNVTAVGYLQGDPIDVSLPEPIVIPANTRVAVRVSDSHTAALTYTGLKAMFREIAVVGGVNVNATIVEDAQATIALATRKGAVAAAAETAQATSAFSTTKGISRTVVEDAQATSTYTTRKGISRAVAEDAQATAALSTRKGAVASIGQQAQATTVVSKRMGALKALAEDAQGIVGMSGLAGHSLPILAYGLIALSGQKGATRATSVTATGTTSISARKGASRTIAISPIATGTTTYRKGINRTVAEDSQAQAAIVARKGAVATLAMTSQGIVTNVTSKGIRRILTAQGIGTTAFVGGKPPPFTSLTLGPVGLATFLARKGAFRSLTASPQGTANLTRKIGIQRTLSDSSVGQVSSSYRKGIFRDVSSSGTGSISLVRVAGFRYALDITAPATTSTTRGFLVRVRYGPPVAGRIQEGPSGESPYAAPRGLGIYPEGASGAQVDTASPGPNLGPALVFPFTFGGPVPSGRRLSVTGGQAK